MMLASLIFDVFLLKHLLDLGPGHFDSHLMGVGLILLAWTSMFLVFTVFLDNQVIGDGER